MTTITNIKSSIFRCSETIAIGSPNKVTVIPSSWRVSFSDGTKKKYTITLSPDNLDPKYSSSEDSKNKKNYYIQIDDKPDFGEKIFKLKLSSNSLIQVLEQLQIKNYLVQPKYGNGKPLFFYVISPKNFEAISIKDILNNFEKIDVISKETISKNASLFFSHPVTKNDLEKEKPNTIKKIKKLELNANEAKILFYDLFETCLLNYIRKKNPSIIDGRNTDKTHLLNDDNKSPTYTKIFKECFTDMFCCC